VKYLIIFLIIFVVAWRWRAARSSDKQETRQKRDNIQPTDMVRCAQCGVHLPAQEAISGRQGIYCSDKHRQLTES
jgi:uncharacterized protein